MYFQSSIVHINTGQRHYRSVVKLQFVDDKAIIAETAEDVQHNMEASGTGECKYDYK